MCAVFRCELVFLTEESRFDMIAEHPSWRRATRVCPARLIALDDLLIGPDFYGMTLTQALHRGFADQGPAMTSNWQLFFNSDFIVADGSLKRLAREMSAGHRLILSPSYCVNSDAAKPILDRARHPETGAITISNRDMAAMILRHRHATVRGKTVNQPLFSYLHNDQFYWLVDDYTLIGHQIPIAMVAMMPLVYLPEPTTYWDYGIVQDFLPDVAPLVLSDSDDFVMAELRETTTGESNLRLGPLTLHEKAMSLHGFATRETTKMAAYQLMLHSRDRPAALANAQLELAEIVRQVIVQAGSLPHHQQHFQWSDHITTMRNVQNAYWARRMKSLPHATWPEILVSTIREFPLLGKAFSESSGVALGAAAGATQQRCNQRHYPFGPIEEAAITEAIDRLLDPVALAAPLTEASAIEITVRFMQAVNLLLQKLLFAAQETYGRAAREVVEALVAGPAVEPRNKTAGSLLGQLRTSVSTISRYERGLGEMFSLQLSSPLTTWIQTVWGNVANLRDILMWASQQPFSLAAGSPAVKLKTIDLVNTLRGLFPSGRLPEDGPEIAGAIRKCILSEFFDTEELGLLFLRVARLAYNRALFDELMTIEPDKSEHVVLARMARTAQAFLDQFAQFAHLFNSHRYLVDHDLAELRNDLLTLSLEAGNTLGLVEKLADAEAKECALVVPLGVRKTRRTRLQRLKRRISWLHYFHATEVHLAKFIAEHGSVTEKAVLHIDSGSSFTHCYTERARVRYWLPLSAARSPIALDVQRACAGFFDVCIVHLDDADLGSFSACYDFLEPMMRAGAMVVVFARRASGLTLRRDDPAFIRGMFAATGYARISYTDSAAARLSASIVEAGKSICRGGTLPRSIGRVIEVGALIAAAPAALGAAWIERPRRSPPSAKVPVNPISVTLEVSVPEHRDQT